MASIVLGLSVLNRVCSARTRQLIYPGVHKTWQYGQQGKESHHYVPDEKISMALCKTAVTPVR